jgi:hypothetical protein
MANDHNAPRPRVRWARLRFQILGPLLAAPADDGELKRRIAEAGRTPMAQSHDGRIDPLQND